jgi:hypothetical protein
MTCLYKLKKFTTKDAQGLPQKEKDAQGDEQ